jgi:hypothetical protein
MLALSTGTNNTFPAVREATIAGLAAGLVATGTVPADGVTARAKLLEARVGDRAETALIDVAVSTERHVGSRAVWDPATLTQLFCAFAEPDAIGLSSILGQLSPVARHEPHGVTARISPQAARGVLAPIAPGLVVPVGVSGIERMRPGSVYPIDARAGVIAVDGERELTFEPGERPTVRLAPTGRGAWTCPRSWRPAPASACSGAPAMGRAAGGPHPARIYTHRPSRRST